jgi:hypothetical protein
VDPPLRGLDHPVLVARRIAEAGIDAVGPLHWLLAELDALRLELIGGGSAIVGGNDQATDDTGVTVGCSQETGPAALGSRDGHR